MHYFELPRMAEGTAVAMTEGAAATAAGAGGTQENPPTKVALDQDPAEASCEDIELPLDANLAARSASIEVPTQPPTERALTTPNERLQRYAAELQASRKANADLEDRLAQMEARLRLMETSLPSADERQAQVAEVEAQLEQAPIDAPTTAPTEAPTEAPTVAPTEAPGAWAWADKPGQDVRL